MRKRYVLGALILMAVFSLSEVKEAKAVNSYGGVCCQIEEEYCQHPMGIFFDDARWMKGLDICPPGGVH